jgi:hypothetical protein
MRVVNVRGRKKDLNFWSIEAWKNQIQDIAVMWMKNKKKI